MKTEQANAKIKYYEQALQDLKAHEGQLGHAELVQKYKEALRRLRGQAAAILLEQRIKEAKVDPMQTDFTKTATKNK